ncbi:MAG: hypothetical protein WD877_02780 [Candidatus Saccharimonadales bacterium]
MSKRQTSKQISDRLSYWLWGSLWRRAGLILVMIVLVWFAMMWLVAQWYIAKHNDEPLVLGTTYISDYAESLGLEPKETLEAILDDLNMKHIRLVSYWKEIESTPGIYDFSNLDWQFDMAEDYGAEVSLAIGLRQPRWPECHEPRWVRQLSKQQWQPQLYKFIGATIDRYKNHPSLVSYQLENEFFMKVFGECTDFDRQRLTSELELVKTHDPDHRVIISRSNNWIGLPIGQPRPDQFGISVYKRVWDKTVTKRYFEYPLPSWFYGFLAGAGELLTGKDMMIHELQAEPWPPQDIRKAPLQELYKSMDAKRLKDRIDYGKATGMRTIELWGAEWWYWLKEKAGDDSVWDVVMQEVAESASRVARPSE